MNKVVVIGGGPAGMMAAISAAKEGALVTLLEKNEKTGKKLYITGKGRCNVTNDCDADTFFKNVITNPKFLYSSYYSFDQYAVMNLIEEAGCPLKTERGNRVFPVSDHSADVLKALNSLLKRYSVDVKLNTIVTSVSEKCVYTNKGRFEFDKVIIATGGVSYPSTGSTGDGYKFAMDMGMNVVEAYPALVPLETIEEDAFAMQGLSLKNVSVKMTSGSKKVYEDFGEMLFTHFGLSGPLILSASSKYAGLKKIDDVQISIDLKPALNEKELDDRILRDFGESLNKQFKNAFDKLLPQKMIPVMIKRTGIPEEKRINEITKEERALIVNNIKNFTYHIKGTRPFTEAIITKGGVSVKDINPSTMESKLVKGVYFAGEVIDVDALTGGFNLQIAWSTGCLAGVNAAGAE